MKSFAFPGNIEEHILSIAAGQVPYMRTPWFSEMTLESESMLLQFLDCHGGRILPFTASGTVAMESAVTSFVASHKRALVLNGGTFGARWRDLCVFHKVPHDEVLTPFGEDADLAHLESAINSGRYDVLLMQHHETSSGSLHHLETIASLCQIKGVALVVDAISSFLSDEFSMDRYGVQLAVISSQKGLNLPPGLSFIAISKTLAERGAFRGRSFAFDWNAHLTDLQRGQTPFSPATHLFMQLNARLRDIQERGLSSILEAVKRKAADFRRLCRAEGWSLSAATPSNCLTGILLPFKARALVNHLNSKEIYVMPSRLDNMIRVTHIGTLDCDAQMDLIEEIRQWQRNTNG